MARDLVPVHGGLEELVDRTVPLAQRKELVAEAARLPSLRVARADLATVHRIGDGALSPLDGPMRHEAFERVLQERVVVSRGKRYAWTIPLALPIGDDEAGALRPGGSVALRDDAGVLVGIVDESETFPFDRARYVERVYGTKRFDHPGGRMVEAEPRTRMLGGTLRALPPKLHPEYGEYLLTPRMTRALIRDRKWQRALAFQTRNPLHRAHEYALVAGAERLTGEGFFTGVVLNALVGEVKGGAVSGTMTV